MQRIVEIIFPGTFVLKFQTPLETGVGSSFHFESLHVKWCLHVCGATVAIKICARCFLIYVIFKTRKFFGVVLALKKIITPKFWSRKILQ